MLVLRLKHGDQNTSVVLQFCFCFSFFLLLLFLFHFIRNWRNKWWVTRLRNNRRLEVSSPAVLWVITKGSRPRGLFNTVQELCESRGGRPGLSVLTSLLVSMDVKLYWTMLRHWSQLVPNNYVNRHPRTISNTTTGFFNADFSWETSLWGPRFQMVVGGGGGGTWREVGAISNANHNQNDSCIKMSSDESHFKCFIHCEGQGQKTVSINHNFPF